MRFYVRKCLGISAKMHFKYEKQPISNLEGNTLNVSLCRRDTLMKLHCKEIVPCVSPFYITCPSESGGWVGMQRFEIVFRRLCIHLVQLRFFSVSDKLACLQFLVLLCCTQQDFCNCHKIQSAVTEDHTSCTVPTLSLHYIVSFSDNQRCYQILF